MAKLFCLSLTVLLIQSTATLEGEEKCEPSDLYTNTNDFFFRLESLEAGRGDIVPLDLYLQADLIHSGLFAIAAVGCFDPANLELVGDFRLSPEFQGVAFSHFFAALDNGPDRPHHVDDQHGFVLAANVETGPVQALLSSGEPLHLGTLFFRILGERGDEAEVRLCDGEWHGPPGSNGCDWSFLAYEPPGSDDRLFTLSDRHVSGVITVREGEATTVPPDTLPSAQIYDQNPPAAEVLFELTGAEVRPGERAVPLELYITSSHEFSGYSASLSFPPHLIEIAAVREERIPGIVRIDPEEGWVGLLKNCSSCRLAEEGERAHFATLLVNVAEDAPEGDFTVRFEPWRNYLEWVGIRVRDGLTPDLPTVQTQVEPLTLNDSSLKVRLLRARRGDSNLDESVNLTDAIVILRHLFTGESDALMCPGAADTTRDAQLDLSDAISLLQSLFLAGPPLGTDRIPCRL